MTWASLSVSFRSQIDSKDCIHILGYTIRLLIRFVVSSVKVFLSMFLTSRTSAVFSVLSPSPKTKFPKISKVSSSVPP
jgi:hypothetical protein